MSRPDAEGEPRLLFEIWYDPDDDSKRMYAVCPANDAIIAGVTPNAVLRHSFWARSDFEAFRTNWQWQGWGEWQSSPGWTERLFTEQDRDFQAGYLARRRVKR